MRKILCLLLAVTLIACTVFALGSCKKEVPIFDIFAASKPTKATSVVSYTDAEGRVFEGSYVLTVSGTDYIFEYSYRRLRTIDEAVAEGTDELVKTVVGAVYSVGGTTVTVGDEFDSFVPALDASKLTLKEEFLSGASRSEDGRSVTAKLTGGNVSKTLGVDLFAEGDVSITAKTDGVYARGVDLAYTAKSGATVSINTSYSYNPVTVELP